MISPPANRIPWLRIAVEGVLIVVSILLAFGIDAWWDRNRDDDARRELVAALRAEFLAGSEELARAQSLHRRRFDAAGDVATPSLDSIWIFV